MSSINIHPIPSSHSHFSKMSPNTHPHLLHCFNLIMCMGGGVCAREYRFLRAQRHQKPLELEWPAIVSCPSWVLGTKLRPLAGAVYILTTEPSLQPHSRFF